MTFELPPGELNLSPLLPDEILFGFPDGVDHRRAEELERIRGTRTERPEHVLSDILAGALSRPPCVVAFSGGRDSSLILAYAARTAREHGLEPPVALTHRYASDDVEANEDQWQERVVGHLQGLGLRFEWNKVEIDQELNVLAPMTTSVLKRVGRVLFPPAISATVFNAALVPGGTVVTGEFGDELFWTYRSTAIRQALRGNARGVGRRRVLNSINHRIFPRISVGIAGENFPWLKQAPRRRFEEMLRRDLRERFWWSAGVRETLSSRYVALMDEACRGVSGLFGTGLVEPLKQTEFVHSWTQHSPKFGLTRTESMRLLAGDLLPDDVLARTSKAAFGESRFGEGVRQFAENWSGHGLNTDDVDVEVLRETWLQGECSPQSVMLLHAAWLNDNVNN